MPLTLAEEEVLTIIGSKGYARMKELTADEAVKGILFSELFKTIKQLIEKGFLVKEIVRIAASDKYSFHTFELTEKGKKEVEPLLGKAPVPSKKQVLLEQYGSIILAYLVEDCRPHLEEKGILLTKNQNGFSLTINNQTYPLFIDVSSRNEERTIKSNRHHEAFDAMYAQSPVFFYLSASSVISSFLVLDHVETWIKKRFDGQKELPFTLYTSYVSRILEGEGDQWDTLGDLWVRGIEQFGKLPNI